MYVLCYYVSKHSASEGDKLLPAMWNASLVTLSHSERYRVKQHKAESMPNESYNISCRFAGVSNLASHVWQETRFKTELRFLMAFYASLVPVSSLMIAQEGPKPVGDYNSM
jgi:hypothetical protein